MFFSTKMMPFNMVYTLYNVLDNSLHDGCSNAYSLIDFKS